MDQNIINAAIGLMCAGFGWWMKTLWSALRDLQHADSALVERVNSIEVLVAGQYVRRDEIEKLFSAVFAKLDKIDDKLDGKADK